MPTYDYVCQACQHAFEHWQTMTSPVKRSCPKCKKRRLRRLIGSGAGVIFKGSGFYETDYKRKSHGKGKPEKDEPASDGDSSSGDSKTSDAKSSDTKQTEKAASQKPDSVQKSDTQKSKAKKKQADD